MILKKTFMTSGTSIQDVAADLNAQIAEFLTTTELFTLASVGTGNGNRPLYTLKHVNSEYSLVLQSYVSANANPYILAKSVSGSFGEKSAMCSYGSTTNARITLHIITSGTSFCYKIFDYNGVVCLGGSCLKYRTFSGLEGYMYSAAEISSCLGYMGRGHIDEAGVYQISHTNLRNPDYTIIQEHPIISLNGGNAIGYAEDIVTINASHLGDSHAYSLFSVNGETYPGGRMTISSSSSYNNYSATYAAVAMKNG